MDPRLQTLAPAAVLLVAALIVGAFGAASSPAPPALQFGIGGDGIELLERHGVHTTYTQLWAGAWLDRDGWKGFHEQLRRVHQTGRTPMIQFYYWGNDLTETCFRDGCDAHGALRKDQAGWDRLAKSLGDALGRELRGEPAVIVLETEFNKHLRRSEALDAALAQKARQLSAAYPQATIVLGFGNWGREDWPVFDRAAASADEIGLQLMRGSRRDGPDAIRNAPDSLLDGAREAQRLFRKPIFVTDIALSSHGGPAYEQAQADAIRRLFEIGPGLEEAGVHALVYRSLLDNPSADTSDYYGEAERHFGLVWTHNRTAKPAFHALLDGLAETTMPPASAPPKTARHAEAPPPHVAPRPIPINAEQSTRERDLLR